jgi:hypothetical protein
MASTTRSDPCKPWNQSWAIAVGSSIGAFPGALDDVVSSGVACWPTVSG